MPTTYFILGLLVGAMIGAIGVYMFLVKSGRNIVAQAKTQAEGLLTTAKLEAGNKAKEIELKARGDQMEARKQFEKE